MIIRFFRRVFTIAIGCLLAFLALCLVIVFVVKQRISSMYSPCRIENNAVLTLLVRGRVVEIDPYEQIRPLLDRSMGEEAYIVDLRVIKKAIEQATIDSRIKAIFLKLDYLQAGFAALDEIRDALLAFKEAGKTIVAYGANYTHISYYLASVADEIFINPNGFLAFKGLSVTVQFHTNLLDKLSIKPIVFRAGAYKSAVEPYYLHQMSPESKAQTEAFLSSISNCYLGKIAQSRHKSISYLKAAANDLSAVLPQDALYATLITQIDDEEGVKQWFKKEFYKTQNRIDHFFVDYRNYLVEDSASVDKSHQKIAVVAVEGEIWDGQSHERYVGGDDLVRLIKAIQRESSIKAVVLRINSPGGFVTAADEIWRALEELKATKKLVASLSSMAASGGYELALPCDYIFAQPTTLTGSIGVWALWFDCMPLMQKVGIEQDVVKTAPSADWLKSRFSFREQETNLVNRWMQNSYSAFLHKVAKGRRMDLMQVKKLAGGRIYSGIMAKENGLVDALGGIGLAVQKAAELAHLENGYKVVYLHHYKPSWRQLLYQLCNNLECFDSMQLLYRLLSGSQKELSRASLQHYARLHCIDAMRRWQGIQAMLPYSIEIA